MSGEEKEAAKPPEEIATLQEFLATVPPGSERVIKSWTVPGPGVRQFFRLNRTKLYCPSAPCQRVQFFDPPTSLETNFVDTEENRFFYLVCSNCRVYRKVFSVWMGARAEDAPLRARKYGEFPPYGPPTPARLFRLIQDERELFIKGMRAESQSMGIAAYAYYRRVIESQKDRIFDGFIAVSKHLRAPKEMVEDLEAAKQETQFEKAVGRIKHGIPSVLMIEGQNPLTMLHSTLSEGLHNLSDEACLNLAQDIRQVMIEMAERMNTAMSDNKELQESVKRIMDRMAARGQKN